MLGINLTIRELGFNVWISVAKAIDKIILSSDKKDLRICYSFE
jgi:hypothetical protein